MKFFEYPRNYGLKRSYAGGTFIPQVQDNRYDTSWIGTALSVHIDASGDGTGTARAWTDIFIKCKGVGSYSVNGITVSIPNSIRDTFGFDRSLVDVDGFHNHLYSLDTPASAQTLTFAFPSGAEIAEILILNENRNIQLSSDKRFSRIDMRYTARSALVQTSMIGELSAAPPLNNTRPKWSIDYTARYKPSQATYNHLLKFMREHYNFSVAIDYPRYADMVFSAVFPELEKQIQYISTYKEAGKDLSFTIAER